jgi:hypothetical protein
MSTIEVNGWAASPRITGGTMLKNQGSNKEGKMFGNTRLATAKAGFCSLTKSHTAFSAWLWVEKKSTENPTAEKTVTYAFDARYTK